jgi:hypothetical protein
MEIMELAVSYQTKFITLATQLAKGQLSHVDWVALNHNTLQSYIEDVQKLSSL